MKKFVTAMLVLNLAIPMGAFAGQDMMQMTANLARMRQQTEEKLRQRQAEAQQKADQQKAPKADQQASSSNPSDSGKKKPNWFQRHILGDDQPMSLQDKLLDHANHLVTVTYQAKLGGVTRFFRSRLDEADMVASCTGRALKVMGISSYHAILDSVPVGPYVDYVVSKTVSKNRMEDVMDHNIDQTVLNVPVTGDMTSGQLWGGIISSGIGVHRARQANQNGDSSGRQEAFAATKVAYAGLTSYLSRLDNPNANRCLFASMKVKIRKILSDRIDSIRAEGKARGTQISRGEAAYLAGPGYLKEVDTLAAKASNREPASSGDGASSASVKKD